MEKKIYGKPEIQELPSLNNFYVRFANRSRTENVQQDGDVKLKEWYARFPESKSDHSKKRMDQTWEEFYATIDAVAQELGLDLEKIRAAATTIEDNQITYVSLPENQKKIFLEGARDGSKTAKEILKKALPILYKKLLNMGYNRADLAG